MSERTARVASSVGLHARPASMLAAEATQVRTLVMVRKPGGIPVDTRSVLSLLSLDARCGDELIFSAEGDDSDQALDVLVKVLETDYDQAES